jgi:thymidylate kinase
MPFMRDRIEEGDREFFARVAMGYQAIAAAEPQRIHPLEATGEVLKIHEAIVQTVESLLKRS